MKIIVIGGTGLIGSGVVTLLRARDHEVVAASPSSGVNTVTGEGLTQAFAGAAIVVDVANSPSFADDAAMEFFTAAGRNIAAAETAAGVRHHVALSVVGADRMSRMGYMRAKVAQESAIAASRIPYTILRATQFMEFVASIAGTDEIVALSGAPIQPIAASDVSAALCELALAAPANAMVEIGGPQKFPLYQAVEQALRAKNDKRTVARDDSVTYFGTPLDARTLVADDDARLGATAWSEWLKRQAQSTRPAA